MVALMAHPTIDAAAKSAGVHPRTVRTWLGQETFCAKFREIRTLALEAAVGRLQELASLAVETLEESMKSDNAPTRTKAAVAVLTLNKDFLELDAMASRLDRLEELVIDVQPVPGSLPSV